MNLYQINWKYRDEMRPRFGLLRAREFLMKDAYSFHLDTEDLKREYQNMFDAYTRIFERCELTFRAVEGEAGEIGGDVNHEFMAVAAVGEDDFVWCKNCDYAANVESARRRHQTDWHTPVPAVELHVDEHIDGPERERVHTPGLPGIAGVAEHLGVEPSGLLKCIAFDVDGELGLALVPGDREVNEQMLARAIRLGALDSSPTTTSPRVPSSPRATSGPTSRVPRSWSRIRRWGSRVHGLPERTKAISTCVTPCWGVTSTCTSGLISSLSSRATIARVAVSRSRSTGVSK